MDFPRWLSVLSAVLGSAVISLGMVLQKKGVAWLAPRRGGAEAAGDARYRRDRATWLVGFALNNSLVVFYFFALKALEPSVVGAMMGLNVVFTAAFSALALDERVSRRTAIGSAALVAFIAAANLSSPAGFESSAAPFATILAFYAAPFLIAAAALGLRRRARLGDGPYASLFALCAGCLEGIVIVLVKAMGHAKGGRVLSYLATPYLYMYVVATVGVVAFMQVAYSHGRMTAVAPSLWGAQIAYPVLIAYSAYSVPIMPIQALSFAGIFCCVVIIQSARPEGRPREPERKS